MAAPAPEEEGFKITDRRFRRDDAEPLAATKTQATTKTQAPRPVDDPHRPPPSRSLSGPPTTPPDFQATRSDSQAAGAPGSDRSLAGLFIMLASEAAIALGEVPDPITGERSQDLRQAAGVIDVLVLLREKTESRRTLDETQILDQLIHDLQMSYVQASQAPG